MIYAIRAAGTDFIKFGSAADVQQRLSTLQTGCPLELEIVAICHGSTPEEAYIHHVLMTKAKAHQRGEWFKDCPEVQAIIKDMQNSRLKAEPAPTHLIHMANRRLRIPVAREPFKPRGPKKERASAPVGLAPAQEARKRQREAWWRARQEPAEEPELLHQR